MNFKEQYSNDMQHIIPTEEQCEKIRARVYEEIQKPQTIQMAQKRKKPLPLKTIAITGASVACLALVATFALKFSAQNSFSTETAEGAAVNTIVSYGNYDKAADNAVSNVAHSMSEASNSVEGVTADTANDDYTRPEAKDSIASSSSSQLPSTEQASAIVVKMVFSESMSECAMYKGDAEVKYALNNEAPLNSVDEKLLALLPAINSNIEKTLYVYFEDNKLWVYDEDKQFIGCYSEIG
ncbi:MAG: hypothetical protein ACI4JY_09075 [Oscillospiraceae bacterium]